MKFRLYIKDKFISILLYIFSLLLVFLLLYVFKLNIYVTILILSIELCTGLFVLLYDFYIKNRFYNNLINNTNLLDKKYLVHETLLNISNNEEKVLYDILYDINKSYFDNITNIEKNINDFKEFVELWIHEVKIPISSLVLKCHNNKKYSKDFIEQINRLDNYVDLVLYYVRSEYTEKDFVINECNLKDIIRNVSLKNKDDILDNNIEFVVDNIDVTVLTDSKWLEFIINQVINNSIKYKKEHYPKIIISACIDKDNTILNIWDNGIGICKKDINKVFNKTFTGSNGRSKVKSTGMGLYIVKNLCDKLGHKIIIDSKESEYTNISIVFSNNKYFKF